MKSIRFFFLQSIFLFCIAAAPVMRLSTARILGNETDRISLLAFKDQITPPPTGVMSSWNNSLHFCQWGGVTCGHRHQRVTKLDLSSQGLTGSISPSIGNLSFLLYVNLNNNSLHGEIPKEMGSLFRLQILGMSNNSLSGPIPVNLSHCSNLDILLIAYNKLTGKIPEEFGSLSKLVALDLHNNNLIGKIPDSLGNLTSLETLYLSINGFHGSIPDSLSQLKPLVNLLLHENSLSGMVPPLLYNLSSLEFFSIALNQLEGSPPHNIGVNLPNIRGFYLGGNKFVGPLPALLFVNSSSIHVLDLGYNHFTGSVPREVGILKGLEILQLGVNRLGTGGKVNDLHFIPSLNNCSNLQFLGIFQNQFGGSLPASVSNLSIKLNRLQIEQNHIIGSIPSEIGNLANLIAFTADGNLLTGFIPKGIGMLHKLQKLVLNENRLSGQIPYSIGNMTSLYHLDLSHNILEGKIITHFDKCSNLQKVFLNHNHLTGIVSKQLLGLFTQLTFVNLSHNHLNGALPLEVGNLINLVVLDISENKISGEIPSTLGSCLSLRDLHVQGNFFQGPIPSSFTNLKVFENIDFSRNNLSGNIPNALADFPYLISLNLSFNDFEGEVPRRGIFLNLSAFSTAGNHKLCGGITELHLPNCHIRKSKEKVMRLGLKVALGFLVPMIIITSMLLVLYLRKKPSSKSSSIHFLPSNLQRVTYNELYVATNGFSSESLIGMGSFGSVYKGVLYEDESLVAVKVFNLMERGASKSYMVECEVLREIRHRNLLKLLTVCSSIDFDGNDFKAIIFEFIPNGSLENWLHPSSDGSLRRPKNLNLSQRINIAIDVAYALDYLHNGNQTTIVHCDLKPSNVLLDDDMVAYLCDFGLAKFLCKNTSNSDKNETSSIAVRGTIGYIPPEYGMGGEVSTHGDMYSYGILLLEMFTGKRPTDEMFKDSLNLHSFCKVNLMERVTDILDGYLLVKEITDEYTNHGIVEQRGMTNSIECLMTNSMKKCLISIIEIGVACSSEPIGERMDIKDVLIKLQKLKQVFDSIGNQEEM